MEYNQEYLKQAHEEKAFTLNERKYELTNISFGRRTEILAYFSKMQSLINNNDFSFIADKDFKEVFSKIENVVIFDGNLLGKQPKHFEEYPQDYIEFIMLSFSVISFPFFQGKTTD